jgi:pimeloyl-ACP methyl ester carboxylesterase
VEKTTTDPCGFLDRSRHCLRDVGETGISRRYAGMLLYLAERLDFPDKAKTEDQRSDLMERWRLALDAIENETDFLGKKRGTFEWAYQSNADMSGQPISLHVPEAYGESMPMPLVVMLHGLGGDHRQSPVPGVDGRCIQVSVNGRGSPFYRGLGELDVLETTDYVLAQYNIDPTRIYLYGGSMGGWGVMRMATRYPDRWTAGVVLCGWAYGLDLEKLSEMPLQIHHGDDDRMVPVDHMRLATEDMKKLKCPADYFEYPGVGHGVSSHAESHKPLDFLLRHSRKLEATGPHLALTTMKGHHAGGFFRIYDGQPIHFSTPAGWQDQEDLCSVIERYQRTADMLTEMPHGQIPMLGDDVTSLSSVGGHVVLIGAPSENALVAELLQKIPVAFNGDRLEIEGVGSYPAESTSMSLFCRNPYSEKQRVLWLLRPEYGAFPIRPIFTFWSWVSCHPDIVIHDVSGTEPVLLAAANMDGVCHACAESDSTLPDSVVTYDAILSLAARVFAEHFDADHAILPHPSSCGRSSLTRGLTLSSLKAMTPRGLQPIARADLAPDQATQLKELLHDSEDLLLFSPRPDINADGKQSFVFCETLIEILGCRLSYDFPAGSLHRTGADVHDLLESMIFAALK